MNRNDIKKMVESWEEIKRFLYPILLPAESVVREKDISKSFLDLEVCIAIRFTETSEPVRVTKETLVKWNTSEWQLYEQAMKNMLGKKPVFCSVEELVERMVGIKMERKERQIMILTNDASRYGAVEMLNLSLLAEYAKERDRDLYILPTSIHEVMVIEAMQEVAGRELKSIVMSMNREEVSAEERLSDHVYYFSRKDGKISIAA